MASLKKDALSQPTMGICVKKERTERAASFCTSPYASLRGAKAPNDNIHTRKQAQTTSGSNDSIAHTE
jgi:hypothetical protein